MLFDEPSRQPLPKTPEFSDVIYAAKKGAASLIPGGGELFELLTSPLAQRRDDWWEDLERRLHDLEAKVAGFRFDDLGKNEQFVSATLQATQAALRTHHAAKLDALRNAVLNISVGIAPSEDKQSLFLHFVDRFSTLHLRILTFAVDTEKHSGRWAKTGPGRIPIHQFITIALPDIADEFQLINAVVSELGGLGLIGIDSAAGSIPTYSKWITHLGEEFLRFISEPELTGHPGK